MSANTISETELKDSTSTLSALFKSFDSCSCQHPYSTLSPSAYLADTLQFLKSAGDSNNKNLYSKLIERRPDIQYIDLEENNSHTLIPYIDIVNEVMESAVSGSDIHLQTTKSSEAIEAYPQYRDNNAYSALSNTQLLDSTFPFKLPLEESRAYLTQAGTSLSKLINTINNNHSDISYTYEAAIERLGFASVNSVNLSSEDNPADFWGNYYKSPQTNTSGALKVLPLLKDLDINHDELLEILKTKFVNPNNAGIENYASEGCALDDETSISVSAVKLLSFYRFSKIAGFTYTEADEILETFKAVTGNTFTQDFFKKIAILKDLQKETGLPVTSLLTWWQPTTGTAINIRDFYNNTFLNPLNDNDIIEEFKLSENNTLINTDENFKNKVSALLNISESEYDEFNNEIDLSDTNLNSARLINFIGLVNFCKATKITYSEYKFLYKLTGIKGVSATETSYKASPADSLIIFTVINHIKESGFSIDDLAYLLLNINYAETEIIPKYLTIKDFAEKLSKALLDAETVYFEENPDNFEKFIKIIDEYGREILVYRFGSLLGNDYEDVYKQLLMLVSGKVFLISNEASALEEFINSQTKLFGGTDAVDKLIGPDKIEDINERASYILNLINSRFENIFIQEYKDLIYRKPVIKTFADEFEITFEIAEHILAETDIKEILLYYKEFKGNSGNIPAELSQAIDYIIVPYNDTFITAVSDIYKRANKIVTFIKNYQISYSDLTYISEENDFLHLCTDYNNNSDDFNADWGFSHWLNLQKAIEIQQYYLNDKDVSVFEFIAGDFADIDVDKFATLLGNDDGISIKTYIGDPSTRTVVTVPPVMIYTSNLLLTVNIVEIIDLLKQLGVSFTTAKSWMTAVNSADINVQFKAVSSMRAALRANYSPEKWLNVSAGIMKPIRIKKRDALVKYLLSVGTQNGENFIDDTELYDFFLLDTQMSPCVKTSRVVLAHSVVQLFMMRVHLNFESGLSLNVEAEQEWQWRKKYRAWEAARKVFLYPENWIEPELRTDKSGIFRELEEELLQEIVTDDVIERAYTNYLTKLDKVSKLTIGQHFLR